MESQVRHNGSPQGIAFVTAYEAAARSQMTERNDFCSEMRALGCKVVIRDNGWVDRTRHRIFTDYADYVASEVAVGDLVAIGTNERWRVVRVSAVIRAVRTLVESREVAFDPFPVFTGGAHHG